MKRIVFVFTLIVALTAGSIAAQQQAELEQARKREQNRSFDGTPLDPFKEGARVRAKELAQKNHDEMKVAAAELADLSQKLNEDVIASGENVISARIFDRLDKIEKLTKRIRDKAKGSGF